MGYDRLVRAVVACLCATLGGCGRIAFDGVGASAGGDGKPADEPLLITMSGVGDNAIYDVAFDPAGDLAFTGSYSSTVTFGSQTQTSVATGGFDLFVAAADRDGTPRWLRAGGATISSSGQNLGYLPDGGVVVGGYFAGTLTGAGSINSGSGQDALWLRLAADGSVIQTTHFGSSSNVQTRGLAVTSAGVATVGIYRGTVDFGAGALPATAADNGFVVTSDLLGGTVRDRAFNGGGDVYVNDVALGAGGEVCIVGRFQQTTDFGGGPVASGGSSGFVARYDGQLALRWARTFGSSTVAGGVAFAANGDCVAIGSFGATFTLDGLTASLAGTADGWVARFESTTGTATWLHTLGGTGDDLAFAVATYPPDRIAIAGRFEGSADLAGLAVQAEGVTDGYVLGLSGDGNVIWSQLLTGSGTVPTDISGMATDATGTSLALAFDYSGELRVGTASSVAPDVDGAVAVLPIPP
jgi:hypothetical protein